MLPRLLVALIPLAALSVPARADDAKKDLEKLRGTWDVVEHGHRGRLARADRLQGYQVVLDGDTLRMVSPDTKTAYKIRLHPDTRPQGIDLTFLAEDGDKGPLRGIYRLQGDKLTLTVDMRVTESKRPEKFEAKEETPSVMLWVLERVKAEKAK